MEKALNVDIRQFYREDLGVHSEELLDKLEAVSQAVTLQKGEILNKKGERQKVPPDKKTSWGKRERYSFGYAVFLILALMK